MAIEDQEALTTLPDLVGYDSYLSTYKLNTFNYLNNRSKALQKAKHAFLSSTISEDIPDIVDIFVDNIKEPGKFEDSSNTGGGDIKNIDESKSKEHVQTIEIKPSLLKNTVDAPSRKVSFRVKKVCGSHKYLTTKPSFIKIRGTKVAELAQRYNELDQTSIQQCKSFKLSSKNCSNTLAKFGSLTQPLSSNSSNIKIMLKHKRPRKNSISLRKSQSMESLDKVTEIVTSTKRNKVNRTKSEDIKRKLSKDRYDFVNASSIVKHEKPPISRSSSKVNMTAESQNDEQKDIGSVKSVIERLERISNLSQNDINKSQYSSAKPDIPVKKSSLLLKRNIVLKDGIPKIKTLKQQYKEFELSSNNTERGNLGNEQEDKKNKIYKSNKYKTNYIRSNKLTLKAVEIINDNENDLTNSINNDRAEDNGNNMEIKNENKAPMQYYSEIRKIKNESLKTAENMGTGDEDVTKSENENSYVAPNIPDIIYSSEILSNEGGNDITKDESVDKDKTLTRNKNKENHYEQYETELESKPETVDIKERRHSKMNCPLPEIPKEPSLSENIYQCLLEMRSHPEGDEGSDHSYEMCNNELEVRTRGDGDSDDGYEYCKTPNNSKTTLKGPHTLKNHKNYDVSKSASSASTVSYEKIDSDSIYERIPARHYKCTKVSKEPSFSDYSSYNDGENIYDTIKHPDGTSLSNCYESIPNSPGSIVKMRNKLKLNSHKRLSFDNVSTISRSTVSSEHRTNSIYGQRSVISYSGQEVSFQVTNSETSISDRSDRSDDWVDISDQEDERRHSKIIIVHEKNRGRKSPVGWSQKVRHQWEKSPNKTVNEDGDSSDSGHYYESLDLNDTSNIDKTTNTTINTTTSINLEDDFDSFDSDSDTETNITGRKHDSGVDLEVRKLPDPPSTGNNGYTLTKIANAASKKMKELKRNLTRRYNAAQDSKNSRRQSDLIKEQNKNKSSPVYANTDFSNDESKFNPIYGSNKTEYINNKIKDESKIDRRNTVCIDSSIDLKSGSSPNMSESKIKDGTLSRKTYFSLKSRFRRPISIAVDINSEVPGPLKITNSTFYLTESLDGDSGFSNCSDNVQPMNGGSVETLQPAPMTRKRSVEKGTSNKSNLRPKYYDSSPNLTLYPEDSRHRLIRPNAPPPPPPIHTDLTAVNEELKRLLPSLNKRDKMKTGSRTSWYAECDLAENTELLIDNGIKDRPTSTSWYAEMGLYYAGSSSSSSGASSASPTPHHHTFIAEPLYQFYNAAKLESVCRETTDSESEGYEAITEMRRKLSLAAPVNTEQLTEPTTMTPERNESPKPPSPPASVITTSQIRAAPNRTLWCQLPEVQNSAVLSSLSTTQKRLQEAKFEILTSEASYLNSLSVLEKYFINHPAFRDENILSRTDSEILFGTIIPVRKCSQVFMNDLEKCWRDNILLHGLCEVIRVHAEKHFDVYIKYCENQIFLVKTLQRLKSRPVFCEVLSRLESNPACQSLSLHSFLMLPMQRVTRLPLLVDAVLKNLDASDEEYQSCMDTLATLNSLVSECNEGARNMERVEEMYRLAGAIEFPKTMKNPPSLAPACPRRAKQSPRSSTIPSKPPPLVPTPLRHTRPPQRHLVRSGPLTQLMWREDHGKLTFGKKIQKIPLYVFLFTDVIVITKKKGEESFVAIDYCQRSLIEVSSGDVMSHLNMKESPGKHLMLLTLLENHENKTVEMVMSCSSETDASRWVDALSPATCRDGECVYDGWDCPQVAALYPYRPSQPDELALSEGDIVNVSRKMPDGWYFGERIRDCETGWFPGNYTIEVASPHVRARNLKQRYRLLALSGSYLGQKKKQTS